MIYFIYIGINKSFHHKRKKMQIRQIKEKDNDFIYNLIRSCLEDAQLNIPGTAYFDEAIKKMSDFYLNKNGRNYFIITDQNDNALGGCGFAEFGTFDKSLSQKGTDIKVCELQKLYISKQARGKGFSYKLISLIEQEAKNAGYHKIYLETHHNLPIATQLYQKLNYTLLQNALPGSEHSTMDYFFIKDL